MRDELLAGAALSAPLICMAVAAAKILEPAGVYFGDAYTAIVLSMALSALALAVWAKKPLALAPDMGLTAYLVFIVTISDAWPWAEVRGGMIMASVIVWLAFVTGAARAVVRAVPPSIGAAVVAGTGLWLVYMGFRVGHVIISSPLTISTWGFFADPLMYYTVLGVIVTLFFVANGIRGALFWGTLFTFAASYMEGFVALPDAPFFWPEGLKDFGEVAFPPLHDWPVVVMLAFLLLTDSLWLSWDVGESESAKPLAIVPLAGILAALLGSVPMAFTPETKLGIAAGGRTKHTALVVAVIMFAALLMLPLLRSLADFGAVVAPSLVIGGLTLMRRVSAVTWQEPREAWPALLTVAILPLTGSIAAGVGVGVVAYAVLTLFGGHKAATPLVYVLALLFCLYFAYARI